jgi:hypothetical protein
MKEKWESGKMGKANSSSRFSHQFFGVRFSDSVAKKKTRICFVVSNSWLRDLFL